MTQKQTERASDIMKRWFERVWNDSEEAAIGEMFPEHGEATGLGDGSTIRGPEQFKEFWRAIHDAFETVRVDVIDSVESADGDDRCYVRCRGTFGFKQPNGEVKDVFLEGGGICKAVDGQVLTADNCWDFLGLLQSMGAICDDAFALACAHKQFTPIECSTA